MTEYTRIEEFQSRIRLMGEIICRKDAELARSRDSIKDDLFVELIDEIRRLEGLKMNLDKRIYRANKRLIELGEEKGE